MFQTLRVTTDGGVATITLARPERRNALSSTMALELTQALDTVVAGDARALVLTGEGGAFCAGMDLREAADPGATGPADAAAPDPFTALEALDLPIVAAIEGPCLGAGLELAICCDLRVAATTASLGLPEVRVGIVPGGAIARLARLVGPGRARQLILTGDPVGGTAAEQWGLVNAVTPEGAALAVAAQLAERLATAGPGAVRESKRLLREGEELPLADAVALELSRAIALLSGPEAQEGMRAFAERRQPRFGEGA